MGNCWDKKNDPSGQVPFEDTAQASSQEHEAPTDPSINEDMRNPVTSASGNDPVGISNIACFGAGCYWGTEKFFTIDFARRRYPEILIRGQVGFMGPEGAKENPTYKEVCEGTTGHVEVFHFNYKGDEEMYEQIVRFFFQFHDPTTLNRQKNDKGPQYASVIYYDDVKQMEIAVKVKDELQALMSEGKITCFAENKVTTAILPATTFHPAHDEHQEYLSKNPKGYCNHRIRFSEWP